MSYKLSGTNIRDNQIVFVYEECSYPGVRRIAGAVRSDMEKVFGAKPIGVEYANFFDTAGFFSYPVFFGTVGNSAILDKLAETGKIDLFGIAAEREVYSINIIDDLEYEGFYFESAIVIAGSDKRGTIYGLFALSELCGVSPLTDWMDIRPKTLKELTLKPSDSYTSKTPSVRYRGFFINDEWPAFGTWAKHNYGGFNAKMYRHVFELLLRLKGNYIWPAMWTSVFFEDGPDEASAALADELGVIIGTSHHEPCLRAGEEYSHLRGPGSPYGDAWDFRSNRSGIIKFWEDALEKRSRFENVITLGMRGEADTAILGQGSSLADNIELLRDVLSAQNAIIKEKTGKDPADTARVFALYKEVEPFYYGDAKTPGLIGDDELDGVILLLSDDNHGNLRTLPDEKQRDHRGGYGMYYHLDYHGAPVSYEWMGTSYLPKIWEQMTQAYDCGVRDMWIVNAGDIYSNEYALSFFLDMAYDFDKWGTSRADSAGEYTRHFVSRNFPSFSKEDKKDTAELLLGYTKITHMRRTESVGDSVYAPFAYCESERLLEDIGRLTDTSARLLDSAGDDDAFAFYELVHIPLCLTLNVQKMWLLTGENHAYAAFGSTYALSLADDVADCIKRDRKLTDKLHGVHKDRWYGMASSAHIGFTRWNEEESHLPVVHTFEPSDEPRLIVSIPSSGEHTEGGYWSKKTLTMADALNPVVCGGFIELTCASYDKVSYKIEALDDFLEVSDPGKSVRCGKRKRVFVFVDRMKIPEGTEYVTGSIVISSKGSSVTVKVPVYSPKAAEDEPDNTYLYCGDGSGYMDYISIGAANWYKKTDRDNAAFSVIEGYGRAGAAIKAYPQDVSFGENEGPSVTYRFTVKKAGSYTVRFYASPSNPPNPEGKVEFGFFVNNGAKTVINMIPEGYKVCDGNPCWEEGVLANGHVKEITADLAAGANELTVSAATPGFVLEKIVIFPEGNKIPDSFYGPPQTYRVTK